MCKNVIDKCPLLECCETQQMCNKVVDACLSALNFVPDWFVTHEMLKIVDGIDYDFDNDFDDDFYDGTDDYVDDIDDSFDNYLDNDYDYILSLIA